MSAVTVTELQQAWHAIRAGQFSAAPTAKTAKRTGEAKQWITAGPVLPVLGVHGHCGASTFALALATQAAPARLIECASGPTCGLVGATGKELGALGVGWTRGTRGEVVIDRSSEIWLDCTEVPTPADLDEDIECSVVDVGWDPTHVLGTDSWLSRLLLAAPAVVLVAQASVPSLRRLENTLELLTEPACLAAVVGPPLKRWPKPVTGSVGPRIRHLIAMNRLAAMPAVRSLQLTGLTPDPLPPPVLTTAAELLRCSKQLSSTSSEKETRS